jgi:hypothetical protein
MRLLAVLRSRRLACRAGAAALLSLCAGMADAGNDLSFTEFWPKIDVYYNIDERSRLLFTAAGTRATEGSAAQNTLRLEDAQFTVNFDYTLEPILRKDVPQGEWSKNRLLWARLGLDYGTSLSGGSDSYRSYTGLLELNSRLPVGEDTWLTSRLRADFRDINGEPSQRYRVRIGAVGSAMAFEHPYAPYGEVEVMYDTRYDRWSRTVLKAGFETPIDASWRVEPYVGLQLNKPYDELSRVLGFGLTFKVYLP